MPIQSKSIWQQISNPRESYTDGYGTQREVSEPAIITLGRRAYDKIDRFLNGPETINIDGQKVPVQQGAGLLEVLIDPAGVIGKADDVAKLANNVDNIKEAYKKAMLHIKNRRRKLYRELDAADKGRRVGGMNYAFDLMDEIPGTKAQNKVAAKYNAAKKAGDVEKTINAEKELRKLTRKDFYDPYVDPDGWNQRVEHLIDAPFNGGPRWRFEIPEVKYLHPTQVTSRINPDDYLDKFKMDELRRYKLRRKVNSTPKAQSAIARNAEKLYPINYKTTIDPVYGPYEHPASEIDYINESLLSDYIFDRTKGTDDRLMDILWRRGDLDGRKHPKIEYKYEELPF